MKGKIEVYRALPDSVGGTAPVTADATIAVAALTAALADAPASPTESYLTKGPYFQFNPNAPESFANPLVDSKLLLTDNFVNSIQAGDAREAQIEPATKQTVDGYSGSNRDVITDPNNTANLLNYVPILSNAEVYLLRAQAEIALGQLAAATADINVVHTVEGGLPPYATFTTTAAAIQAVVYEYRYSFILQGPQHLIALREYGLLNSSYVSQPGIPTSSTDPLLQIAADSAEREQRS